MTWTASMSRTNVLPTVRRIILAGACSLLLPLVGCGNYEGGDEEADPNNTFNQVYSGLSTDEQVAAYASTVHPVVTLYCGSGCHDSGAEGAPFLFANSDTTLAYSVVTEASKIDRRSPEQSRIVRRPGPSERHQCGSSCSAIEAEMLEAVQEWAALLDAGEEALGGPSFVPAIESDSTPYNKGKILENGERYDRNQIAFFQFDEGSGETAYDTSGVKPRMNLTLDDAEWIPAYGVEMDRASLFAGPSGSRKLYDEIAKPGYGTGQYTLEFWIQNANVTQESAHIATFSVNDEEPG
jgi:hypothetical protein